MPGRCRRCWVMEQWCICKDIPDVDNQTGVLVLRHLLESRKSTNTSRIAQLALRKMELVDVDARTPPDVGAWLADKGKVWILFPGGTTADVEHEKPDAVLLIDGTWKQARKMVRSHAALLALPRLSLPGGDPNVWRLRTTKHRDAQSSLEAIAEALRIVESPEHAERLHALHQRYVAQVLLARGAFPIDEED